MIDLFSAVFRMLDPILLFWMFVLNIIGYHLKKIGLPKAAPPIPLLLYIVALVPCLALGWAAAPGEGGKAALYALLYGVSNAGLITIPAVWGYDVVHYWTGRTADKRKYRFVFYDPVVDTPKLKALVYPLSAVISGTTAGLVSRFALGETVMYSVCWALLFGAIALIVARTVVHVVFDDRSAEMFAASIFGLFACGAWLGLILCDSWLWVSLWSAVAVGNVLMALGTRFMDPVKEVSEYPEKEEPVPPKKEEPAKKERGETDLAFLRRTCRYRMVGDTLDGEPDIDRPLCPVGTEPMTVDEAEKVGYAAAAAEGLAYLTVLLKKEEK